ncbi:MAG: hypothetical protein HYU66_10450 [Armatimonadetes bacterium]|nr:hypothetical protein [Armatimonadota bacterium]
MIWQSEQHVTAAAWLAEPYAVFATGTDPELAALWERLARLPRCGEVATLHDGVYKSHLVPLLGPGEQAVLLSAREVTRGGIHHAGATVPSAALDRLPAPERARQQSPKLLLHAMRKPALADRLVAAADPHGRYLASNNFLLLLPRPDSGWPLPALAALLRSRLVNRWFADRYLQVNIEAFAVASLPLPGLTAPDELLTALEPEAVDALVYRLYGAGMAEQAAVERRWAGDV